MEKPTPTAKPNPEAKPASKDGETNRLVKVTNALLERAGKLENELIAFHSVQVQMAGDVGYIRGAVDLLSKRVDGMIKGNGKGSKTTTDIHAHSETTPKT